MVSINDEKLVKNKEISEIIGGLLAAKRNETTAEVLQSRPNFVSVFFDQEYFRGDKSLIEKLTQKNNDLEIDSLLEETIDLGKIYDNNLELWNFAERLKGCDPDFLHSLAQNIYNKVEASLKVSTGGGTTAVLPDCYKDSGGNFSLKPVPATILATQCVGYIQDIIDYLTDRETKSNAKKASDVFGNMKITNGEINNLLSTSFPTSAPGPAIKVNDLPDDAKKSFDVLLKYEIGQNVDRLIATSEKLSDQVKNLFSNSLPGINTILVNNNFKYDESKFQEAKSTEIDVINGDTTLTAREKEIKLSDLRRTYYIEYVKTKNSTIGNILEKLHDDENSFDYSKLNETEIQQFTSFVVDKNIDALIRNDYMRTALHINFGDDLDDFKQFYKDLGDKSNKEVVLDKDLNIKLPIQKEVIEGKHPWFNNLQDYFGDNPAPDDVFPLKYTINKNDVENLKDKICIEDMTYLLNFLSQVQSVENENEFVFEGENVGKLIFLFFLINSKHPLSEISPEQQKKVDEIFGKKEEGGDTDDENRPINSLEDPTDTPENFKSEIEKFGKDGSFKNGSEIWMPIGESILPGGGQSWFKIKISDIDMNKGTFKGTGIGGDLDYKGKNVTTFNMNKATLKRFQKGAQDGKVLLLPNPSESDFSAYLASLNGKLGNEKISFPPEGVKRDGNRFTHNVKDEKGNEKEEEVKNFGINDGDNLCTYQIKYQPGKKTFLVSGNFDGKGQDEKDKDKLFHYSYKREMDWNSFLIFMNEKKLKPQTEKEIKTVAQKQNEKTAKEFKIVNGKKLKLNWFSINSFKTAFKSISSHISDQIKAYDKAQAEKLEDILVDSECGRGIYKKLRDVLGFIPSMNEAFGNLQQEYYVERDNKARKAIEGWIKILESDRNFPDTFSLVPPHLKAIRGGSYRDFILKIAKKAENSSLSKTDKQKAAALLIANIEKGGSAYRGLPEFENTGLWVKVLLGCEHYEEFLRDKAVKIKNRDDAESKKNQSDKKGANMDLASCEFEYIINNIRGTYSKLSFGSNESAGENGDYSFSKGILSEQFADRLEKLKDNFSKNSVNEKYESLSKLKNFDKAEDEFNKLWSTRYQNGGGALRAMMDTASNDTLKRRVKKHFLEYLLCGALDIYCNPDLKKQIYGWAKPIAFAPGLLVKNAGVAENVAILLDHASNGDFSRQVTAFFHKKDLLNGSHGDFSSLKSQLSSWLTDERMKQLDKYFEDTLPFEDFNKSNISEEKKKILKSFQNALLSNSPEEFDRNILDNPTMVNNGLISSAEVVRSRLKINRNGGFDGKDSDENGNLQEFWDTIAKSVRSKDPTNPKNVNFVLNQFFNRFGDSYRQETYNWLQTALWFQKNKLHKSREYDYTTNGKRLDMGQIKESDINSIIWYAFKGRVWNSIAASNGAIPDQIHNALNAFQDFFEKAFDEENNGALFDSLVLSDAFGGQKFNMDEPILYLGSWDTYQKRCSNDSGISDGDGDDDTNWKNDKEKKNGYKYTYKSNDGFINSKILRLEQNFKNKGIPSSGRNGYCQVSSNYYDSLLSRMH